MVTQHLFLFHDGPDILFDANSGSFFTFVSLLGMRRRCCYQVFEVSTQIKAVNCDKVLSTLVCLYTYGQ